MTQRHEVKKIAYIRTSNIYDDSRATKEICALAETGYIVFVFGWNRDGMASEKCEEVFEKYGGAVSCYFYPVKVATNIGKKNFHKLLAWFKWTNRCMRKYGPFNVIHACNLDAAVGAWNYIKKTKTKFVYDIYDYYIDSHSTPKILNSVVEKQEIKTINNSDLTIICTEERKEQINKANPKKVIVVHNSPSVDKPRYREINSDYVYCGSLFAQRLLKGIFDEYPNNSDLVFSIAGYGEYAPQARELAKSYDNFNYYGPVSYDAVLKIESGCRVLSAIYKPTIRNHRLCAPNKFYEALALAKPVIVCRGSGIDKIVEQHGIGIVIDYDAKQFYKAVRELSSNMKLCTEMGVRGRKLYEAEYRWSIMKNRLVDEYRELIQ